MMSIRMSDVRRRRFQFRGVKLRKIAAKGERKGRISESLSFLTDRFRRRASFVQCLQQCFDGVAWFVVLFQQRDEA